MDLPRSGHRIVYGSVCDTGFASALCPELLGHWQSQWHTEIGFDRASIHAKSWVASVWGCLFRRKSKPSVKLIARSGPDSPERHWTLHNSQHCLSCPLSPVRERVRERGHVVRG